MTSSQIHYLMTIGQLCKDGGTTVTAVAQKLGYSKASVSRAVEVLAFHRLIEKEGGKIFVTESGALQLKRLISARKSLQTALCGVGLTPAAAEKESHNLVAALSPEALTIIANITMED